MTEAERRQRQLIQMGELAELAYEHDPESKGALDKFAEGQLPGVRSQVKTEKLLLAAEQRIDKKSAEFDLRVEQEKADRVRERALATIKGDPNLRIKDEEIPEVEKVMLKRGIGNYEDGAYAYRRENQVAAPAVTRNLTMEVPGLDPQDGLEWMKGIIRPGFGVDLNLLDRRTKRQAQTIMDDYANGRGSKWE